jgi:hypothetical protein
MERGLVSLYRCKKCDVGMFLHDCAGHFVRCFQRPLSDYEAAPANFFTRGPKAQHARPGDGYLSVYQATAQRASRSRACVLRAQAKRKAELGDDDADELDTEIE